jgi:hypothetical protein
VELPRQLLVGQGVAGAAAVDLDAGLEFLARAAGHAQDGGEGEPLGTQPQGGLHARVGEVVARVRLEDHARQLPVLTSPASSAISQWFTRLLRRTKNTCVRAFRASLTMVERRR